MSVRGEHVFVRCVGKGYSRCEKRLRKECPFPDICYREATARLAGIPHDKFVYLFPRRVWGEGMKSEHIESINMYAVFLEAGVR